MKKNLKLYVWTGVFCDYTDGIAFALATSADHARKLIAKDYGRLFGAKTPEDWRYWENHALEELTGEPDVYARAIGFQQSGGG